MHTRTSRFFSKDKIKLEFNHNFSRLILCVFTHLVCKDMTKPIGNMLFYKHRIDARHQASIRNKLDQHRSRPKVLIQSIKISSFDLFSIHSVKNLFVGKFSGRFFLFNYMIEFKFGRIADIWIEVLTFSSQFTNQFVVRKDAITFNVFVMVNCTTAHWKLEKEKTEIQGKFTCSVLLIIESNPIGWTEIVCFGKIKALVETSMISAWICYNEFSCTLMSFDDRYAELH